MKATLNINHLIREVNIHTSGDLTREQLQEIQKLVEETLVKAVNAINDPCSQKSTSRKEVVDKMYTGIFDAVNNMGCAIIPEPALNPVDKLKADVRRLLGYDSLRFPKLLRELLNNYDNAEHQAVRSIIKDLIHGVGFIDCAVCNKSMCNATCRDSHAVCSQDR